MAQAPSTGQSWTHCSGGGVVVAPCCRRTSSSMSPFPSASRPAVDSNGANPSRQTFLQLSMIALLSVVILVMSIQSFAVKVLYIKCNFVHIHCQRFLSDNSILLVVRWRFIDEK